MRGQETEMAAAFSSKDQELRGVFGLQPESKSESEWEWLYPSKRIVRD